MSEGYQCGQIHCKNNALKKCKVCKLHYCSEECQKKSWFTHKRFCASTFIERLIKFVKYHSFLTKVYFVKYHSFLTGVYFLSKEWQNSQDGTYEALFEERSSPLGYKIFRRCIYCHTRLETDEFHRILQLKEWPGKDYGDLILWKYNTCESCDDKDLCRNCLLPHDEKIFCPLLKRFALLLKGQPWLMDIPDIPFYMIREQVRTDFIDYLLKK